MTAEVPSERPAIVLVDDEPEVLRSVERDIRQRYASSYRIVATGSGTEALDAIDRLVLRQQPVAMVVADQRMPNMQGTELLETVEHRAPEARRILLTAYADTDAAISAINDAHIDYYILKPWDPPDERLYPVIDDLLEEWQAVGRPVPEDGIRVVGDRWSAQSYDLRQFLSRNHVPYRWLDVGRSKEARRLMDSANGAGLPFVVLEDGTTMSSATPQTVATLVGVGDQSEGDYHDLIVVGAGPAGLAAAVYGASEGLSTLVVEAEAPGGQAGASSRIENYLGFPKGVSGEDLARRALTQARRFGASFISPRIARRLERQDNYRALELDDGSFLRCSAMIIATGVQYRELEANGSARLRGRGVYYGSVMSEAESIAGEDVVVVGGANSAGQGAIHLARYANLVRIVVRGESLAVRMSRYLVDQIEATSNIEVLVDSEVHAVHGEDRVESVEVEATGARSTFGAAAVFVFIGARPRTDWLDTMVARDEAGFLLTGTAVKEEGKWALARSPMILETSIPGIFAVGDVRSDSVKRVASAVGDGSVAVQLAHAYLAG